MAKNKCPECEKCLPGWLVQFGDLMSLLLTFFILLLSMAVMDSVKIEEYFDIMKKSMGFLDMNADIREQTDKLSDKQSENGNDELDGTESDTDEASEQIEQAMKEFNESDDQENAMEIVKGNNEFTLDIPSALLFKRGEHELSNKAAKKFISKLSRIVRTMPQSFNIEVTGHTDRNFYKSSSIPRDNWDMSALRAISVAKELIKNRIDPAQIKVSARSSYQPVSQIGPKNRRVEIRFYAENDQKNVLEEENFFDRIEE